MDVSLIKRGFADAVLGVSVGATLALPLFDGAFSLIKATGFVERVVAPVASQSSILGAAIGLTAGFVVPAAISVYAGNAASWGSALMSARKTPTPNIAHIFS